MRPLRLKGVGMHGLESLLGVDSETLYWLLGGGAGTVLTLGFFVVLRMSGGVASLRTPPPYEISKEVPGSEALDRVLAGDKIVRPVDADSNESAEAAATHSPEQIALAQPKALSSALANTRSSFFGRIRSLFGTKPTLDASEMEELEEILYTSDLGPQTVQRLLDAVQEKVRADGGTGIDAVREALKSEMLSIFQGAGVVEPVPLGHNGLRLVKAAEQAIEGLEHLDIWDHKPAVLMVVGVNGAGKTTTIGKLASRLAKSGKKVLVAAGDTFRAAAGDQLKIWTERAQVEIFHPDGVTDPSAVGYAACERAAREGFDIVIIDTAGRLHTQKNLMEELKKMKRVMTKPIPTAPHEVLLVLDANSGQNALIQAREFHGALGVTGVVLTKLDGSAKGGVAIGLAAELKIPIKLIGVGEGIDDLRRFSSGEFVDSIL
jgi:fused signal recognition particle receptor